jgi:predicted transport protein
MEKVIRNKLENEACVTGIQIEPDPRDSLRIPDRLAHGRLPFRWGFDNIHLGTLDAVGAPSTPSPEPPEPLGVRHDLVAPALPRPAAIIKPTDGPQMNAAAVIQFDFVAGGKSVANFFPLIEVTANSSAASLEFGRCSVTTPPLGDQMDFKRAERISLKLHPELDEKWVQELIASDPSILGLGDLVLRDKERIQPRAGRLDLLLQDIETKRRYEIEIQLGPTDEVHIIRTIEYWDIERKRYPQYEHSAVLIAEDITSRFLNVVALFNGTIPLIAIQMTALKVGEHTTLVFTKVMDELSRGVVDEDEDAAAAPTNREYWEERGSKATVQLADDIRAIAREIDQSLELKYNKFYIGFAREGRAFNFMILRPKKKAINIEISIPLTEEVTAKIEAAGIEMLGYERRGGYYRIPMTKQDIAKHKDLLKELMVAAYADKGN